MRKDLFIVGARLLGIWVLIGSVNPIAYVVATFFISTQAPALIQISNIVNGIVHIAVGVFLLLKTNALYTFLDRIMTEDGKNNKNNSAA